MNVEIRTEAAQFPEKEYISGIFVAVHCANMYYTSDRLTDPKPWNLKLSKPDLLWCHSASKKLHNFLVDTFTHIFYLFYLYDVSREAVSIMHFKLLVLVSFDSKGSNTTSLQRLGHFLFVFVLIVAYVHSIGLWVSVVQNEREKISEKRWLSKLAPKSSFNRSKSQKTVPVYLLSILGWCTNY